MNWPIGKDRQLDPETGQVVGTTPVDIQTWIWSLYRLPTSNGAIAKGLEVSGTATMAYSIKRGLSILPAGDRLALAVPTEAIVLQTPEAPSTGTRVDNIYVSNDGVIRVGTTQPAGTALIDKREVPAGITATTATTSLLGDRKYSPLYGAAMGELTRWEDPLAFNATVSDARKKVGSLRFTVDSNRTMDIALQVSYDQKASANSSEDTGKAASYVWETWIDGVKRNSIELAVHSWGETKQNRTTFSISAGTHTVDLYRTRRLTSGGVIVNRGGAQTWPKTSLAIIDVGGVE